MDETNIEEGVCARDSTHEQLYYVPFIEVEQRLVVEEPLDHDYHIDLPDACKE